MPTKATSSFVRTVARERLTARTSGSVARLSIWADSAAISGRARRYSPLRRQDRGGRNQLSDQPLAIDAGDLLICPDHHRHGPVVRVDVVALEVERATVLVDRDLHLVGRGVRDPMIPQLERTSLLEERFD